MRLNVLWPVNAWALRGFDLLLELDPASAARLGLARDVAFHLGIFAADRARLRDALLGGPRVGVPRR